MTALAQLFIYCNMAVMEDVASMREVVYLRSDTIESLIDLQHQMLNG